MLLRDPDASAEPPPTPTVRGDTNGELHVHPAFGAGRFVAPRPVRIWLPPGYGAEPTRRYPVLYLQDGQNLFDDATAFGGRAWRIGATATRLLAQRKVAPLILVGIDNAGRHRIDDYTPVPVRGQGGHAAAYGQMLVHELKPFVDRRYRTLPERAATGIAGASLGGLCALYLALRFPAVFGRAAALSPTLWWADHWLLHAFERLPHRIDLRLWIDAGKHEAPPLRRPVDRLRAALLDLGWIEHRNAQRADLRHAAVARGSHDEASWGRRFDRVLRFLYPPARPAGRQHRRTRPGSNHE